MSSVNSTLTQILQKQQTCLLLLSVVGQQVLLQQVRCSSSHPSIAVVLNGFQQRKPTLPYKRLCYLWKKNSVTLVKKTQQPRKKIKL